MALAIRLDQLIRDGVVTDQAELARLGHVSRARLTQIMNLLCLSPRIQEQLLLSYQTLPRCTEKSVRWVLSEPDWVGQETAWQEVITGSRF